MMASSESSCSDMVHLKFVGQVCNLPGSAGQVGNLPHGSGASWLFRLHSDRRGSGSPISVLVSRRSLADENGHNSGDATSPALTGFPSTYRMIRSNSSPSRIQWSY